MQPFIFICSKQMCLVNSHIFLATMYIDTFSPFTIVDVFQSYFSEMSLSCKLNISCWLKENKLCIIDMAA